MVNSSNKVRETGSKCNQQEFIVTESKATGSRNASILETIDETTVELRG